MEGLNEKVTPELRARGFPVGEPGGHQERGVLGGGVSRCRGPEVESVPSLSQEQHGGRHGWSMSKAEAGDESRVVTKARP